LHPEDPADEIGKIKFLRGPSSTKDDGPFALAEKVARIGPGGMDVSGRERIRIFDTTLRDGEQAPGYSMRKDEKLRMARQLDRLGVDVIEAGFPVASEGDFLAVQAVAAAIRRPIIAALARCCREDIERAGQAVQIAAHPRIHTFLATSDIHLQH
jgi:2-isopropylmalate synthase